MIFIPSHFVLLLLTEQTFDVSHLIERKKNFGKTKLFFQHLFNKIKLALLWDKNISDFDLWKRQESRLRVRTSALFYRYGHPIKSTDHETGNKNCLNLMRSFILDLTIKISQNHYKKRNLNIVKLFNIILSV